MFVFRSENYWRQHFVSLPIQGQTCILYLRVGLHDIQIYLYFVYNAVVLLYVLHIYIYMFFKHIFVYTFIYNYIYLYSYIL